MASRAASSEVAVTVHVWYAEWCLSDSSFIVMVECCGRREGTLGDADRPGRGDVARGIEMRRAPDWSGHRKGGYAGDGYMGFPPPSQIALETPPSFPSFADVGRRGPSGR